jgi:hypothetical protein
MHCKSMQQIKEMHSMQPTNGPARYLMVLFEKRGARHFISARVCWRDHQCIYHRIHTQWNAIKSWHLCTHNGTTPIFNVSFSKSLPLSRHLFLSFFIPFFLFHSACFSASLSGDPFPYSYTYFLPLFLLYLLCVALIWFSRSTLLLCLSLFLRLAQWFGFQNFFICFCSSVVSKEIGPSYGRQGPVLEFYLWGLGIEQEPSWRTLFQLGF